MKIPNFSRFNGSPKESVYTLGNESGSAVSRYSVNEHIRRENIDNSKDEDNESEVNYVVEKPKTQYIKTYSYLENINDRSSQVCDQEDGDNILNSYVNESQEIHEESYDESPKNPSQSKCNDDYESDSRYTDECIGTCSFTIPSSSKPFGIFQFCFNINPISKFGLSQAI